MSDRQKKKAPKDSVKKTAAQVKDKASQALSGAAEKANQLAKTARRKTADLSTGQKVAVGVGVAAALAGLVGAVKLVRGRTSGKALILHLVHQDDTWQLTLEGEAGSKATFETKDEGMTAAREFAASHAPSQLVIHRIDGTIQDRHRYRPQS